MMSAMPARLNPIGTGTQKFISSHPLLSSWIDVPIAQRVSHASLELIFEADLVRTALLVLELRVRQPPHRPAQALEQGARRMLSVGAGWYRA
jgi:hypothetical protein